MSFCLGIGRLDCQLDEKYETVKGEMSMFKGVDMLFRRRSLISLNKVQSEVSSIWIAPCRTL